MRQNQLSSTLERVATTSRKLVYTSFQFLLVSIYANFLQVFFSIDIFCIFRFLKPSLLFYSLWILYIFLFVFFCESHKLKLIMKLEIQNIWSTQHNDTWSEYWISNHNQKQRNNKIVRIGMGIIKLLLYTHYVYNVCSARLAQRILEFIFGTTVLSSI